MAHLRPTPTCSESGCPRKATWSLYCQGNVHYGDYCDRHAPSALKKLQRIEDREAMDAARRAPGGGP